jgi:hypothetical protein
VVRAITNVQAAEQMTHVWSVGGEEGREDGQERRSEREGGKSWEKGNRRAEDEQTVSNSTTQSTITP